MATSILLASNAAQAQGTWPTNAWPSHERLRGDAVTTSLWVVVNSDGGAGGTGVYFTAISTLSNEVGHVQTNLALGAKDQRGLHAVQAQEQRATFPVVYDASLVGAPRARFYRYDRQSWSSGQPWRANLVGAKNWIAESVGSEFGGQWLPGDLDIGGTSSTDPMPTMTATQVFARAGAPTNYWVMTPFRDLAGASTGYSNSHTYAPFTTQDYTWKRFPDAMNQLQAQAIYGQPFVGNSTLGGFEPKWELYEMQNTNWNHTTWGDAVAEIEDRWPPSSSSPLSFFAVPHYREEYFGTVTEIDGTNYYDAYVTKVVPRGLYATFLNEATNQATISLPFDATLYLSATWVNTPSPPFGITTQQVWTEYEAWTDATLASVGVLTNRHFFATDAFNYVPTQTIHLVSSLIGDANPPEPCAAPVVDPETGGGTSTRSFSVDGAVFVIRPKYDYRADD